MDLKSYYGIFISGGTFGDVFRPPLPCPMLPVKFHSKKYVGKLFERKKDGKEQFDREKGLIKLDPNGVFTLAPVAYCKLNLTNTQMAILKKIDSAFKSSENSRADRGSYEFQIVYPYGGDLFYSFVDLIRQKNLDLNLFLNPVLFLLKKLAYMNNSGYYHFDLKTENILYNDDTGLLQVIDFQFLSEKCDEIVDIQLKRGFISQKTDKTRNDIITDLSNFNFVWPPELHLISYFMKGGEIPTPWMYCFVNHEGVSTTTREFVDFYKNFTDESNLVSPDKPGKYLKKLLKTSFYSDLKDFCERLNKRQISNLALAELHALFNFNINKIESWNVGFILLSWIKLVYDSFSKDGEERQILDNVLDVICNHMIQYDINERYTLQDSYNQIMDSIREEFPSFYENYRDFEDAVDTEMKNPEKTTLNHILNKEKTSGSQVAPNKKFKVVRPKSILRSTLGSDALFVKKQPTVISHSGIVPPKIFMPDPKQIQKELLRGVYDPHSTRPFNPEDYMPGYSKQASLTMNPTQQQSPFLLQSHPEFYSPESTTSYSRFGMDDFSPSSQLFSAQGAFHAGQRQMVPSPMMKNYRPYYTNPTQPAFGTFKAEQSLQKLFHSFDKDLQFGQHCQRYMY